MPPQENTGYFAGPLRCGQRTEDMPCTCSGISSSKNLVNSSISITFSMVESWRLTLTRNLSISAVWLNVCHPSLLVCRELAMLVLQSCMYLPLPKLKSVKPAAWRALRNAHSKADSRNSRKVRWGKISELVFLLLVVLVYLGVLWYVGAVWSCLRGIS